MSDISEQRSPEQIRADIEQTRRELGTNVDALADKVTPSKIVDRQANKVRDAVASARERVMGSRVMGSAGETTDSAKAAASSAGDAVTDASQKAVAKAKGNPIAVGLIAFGVGLLAASLVPASEKEKQLADNLKDAAQPLISEASDAAKEVATNLKEPTQDAASAVRNAATDGIDAVKSDAASAKDDVAQQVGDAKDRVQEQTN